MRLIEALRNRGGRVQTRIRRLARHLGTRPTTLHAVAGELVAAGVVRIAGRQGSVFRLVAA
jgi:DNA-binding IclR family transcriptional regulator